MVEIQSENKIVEEPQTQETETTTAKPTEEAKLVSEILTKGPETLPSPVEEPREETEETGVVHISRQGTPILGLRERADKLVSWSSSDEVPNGTLYQKELSCGLLLAFYAQGEEPRMHIHFNPGRFEKLLQQAGDINRFLILSWGFAVERYEGRTKVRLLAAGKTSEVIWDSSEDFCKQQDGVNTNFLRGMVKFSEEGPVFYREMPEAELHNLNNLAVIETGKLHQADKARPRRRVVSVGDVLTSVRRGDAGDTTPAKHSEAPAQPAQMSSDLVDAVRQLQGMGLL